MGMVMMTSGFLLVFFLEQIMFDGHDHDVPVRRNPLDTGASGITTMELKIMQSGKVVTDKTGGLDTRSSLNLSDVWHPPMPGRQKPTGIASFLQDSKNGLILLVALLAHGLLEGFVVGFQVLWRVLIKWFLTGGKKCREHFE